MPKDRKGKFSRLNGFTQKRANGHKLNAHNFSGVTRLLVGNTPYVTFGEFRLSSKDPALIVAEIGLNHCGQMDRALKLIEAAAEAGADAVKFQKRSAKDLLTKEAYSQSYYNNGNSFGLTYGEHREALEFDLESYKDLKAAAEELGMDFFASVWDMPSLEEMLILNVKAIKIPSADLTNEPLIKTAASAGATIFISTGMSQPEEIERAIEILREQDAPFVLFHCMSIYPTPADEARLGTITHYADTYNVPIGYSGHEMEVSIPVAARALGACVIEKHFTLDRSWKGGDQAISLLPEEFAKMVDDVRVVEKALVDVRTGCLPSEKRQRQKLSKSIVAVRPIVAGEIITPDLITCKCPGGGLSPQYIPRLLGRRVKWDIGAEQYILESHLEESIAVESQEEEETTSLFVK